MFFTIYRITNMITNSIYIGAHKTNNLDDGYMGSGKYIKRAINKYGVSNFIKEYLHIFDNAEDMFDMESVLVTEEFIANPNTYNLKLGGCGGFDHINNNEIYADSYKIGRKNANAKGAHLKGANTCKHLYNSNPEWVKNKVSKAKKTIIDNHGDNAYKWFKGMHHSDESKKRMSDIMKEKTQGTDNSQYGTCWIYNIELQESKKIKKEDIDVWINDGWILGRKMKF